MVKGCPCTAVDSGFTHKGLGSTGHFRRGAGMYILPTDCVCSFVRSFVIGTSKNEKGESLYRQLLCPGAQSGLSAACR